MLVLFESKSLWLCCEVLLLLFARFTEIVEIFLCSVFFSRSRSCFILQMFSITLSVRFSSESSQHSDSWSFFVNFGGRDSE